MKEGALVHETMSPTAATLGNPLYGFTGVIGYRVTMANGMGMIPCDVEAGSGDEAANAALARHPGCKVVNVQPAPRA